MASWALPVAVVGGVFLIRELKSNGAAEAAALAEETARRLAAEAAETSQAAAAALLAAAASSGEAAGQAYFGAIAAEGRQDALEIAIADAERLAALQRERGELRLGSNYGTVTGAIGAFTGDWVNVANGADRCSVDFPTVSGRASRFFTGAYCRSARAQGLIN